MKSNKAIRKYFTASAITGLLLILLWLVIFFNAENSVILIASPLLVLLLSKLATSFFLKKYILSVLYKELDAIEFKEILNDRRIIFSPQYHISASISIGDYQTVVNIVTKQLQKKKLTIKVKCVYLSILARVYFELRDFDKLNTLVTKYFEYKTLNPTKPFFNSQDSIWNYYKCFLDGDYESCKSFCQNKELKFDSNKFSTKYKKLQNKFYYAIACLENVETDTALDIFKSIIHDAPNMYFSNVSQKYIEAIRLNQKPVLFIEEITPESNYKIYDDNTVAKMKRKRIILVCLVIVYLVFFVGSHILNNTEVSIFESKLNDALVEYYGEAEIIEYFSVEKEENIIDTFGVVGVGNRLSLVEIVTDDNGDTFEVIPVQENILADKYYCVKSPTTSFYVGFLLSETKIAATKSYYIGDFEFKGNRYWFNVDYIEMFPSN